MRKFQCGALSRKSYGLLMGREGKAIVGHPFPIGGAHCRVGRVGLQLSKSISTLPAFHVAVLTHTAILSEQRHLSVT